MENDIKYTLLGDSPVGETERPDCLEFLPYAKVLARAAIETKNPLTIGIFGQWGTGKTSMMRLMQDEVKKEERATAVWFNAWQYEKEKHLIIPLAATIDDALEKEKKFSTRLSDGIGAMRKVLQAAICALSVKGKVGFPLMSEVEVSVSPDKLIEHYQNLSKDMVLPRSVYFDAINELSKYVKKGTAPRVVVFIDDLDRCFPPNAVKLLEGVKLVLHQPGFSFVLGVNEDIIHCFIKTKYEKDYKIPGSHFEDYLDKIVQVKVPVPERRPSEMNKYIGYLLDEGKVFGGSPKEDIIPLIAEACKCNPRSIVRLLNRIIVTSQIGSEEKPKKEYDQLALLLHMATDEPRYSDFRRSLGIIVRLQDQEMKKVGVYLAGEMGKYTGANHSQWVVELRENVEKLKSPVLKNAIQPLEDDEHLCNLLSHEAGRKWLAEEEYRNMLGEASKRTLGEKKEEPRKDIGSAIRQLQDNLVRIEAGQFMMGSMVVKSEGPVHPVELEAFEIGAMPVTQAQYEAVTGQNPSNFKDKPDNPVENVSWDDAMEFCKKLSEKTGRMFTLPSEAQWEYACRAGSEGRYCFGDNEDELREYAWFGLNSGNRTHPVGEKRPNAWGLYDMHGNVLEWVQDDWHGNYENAPADGSAWIDSPRGTYRVIRGGSWYDDPRICRSAFRYDYAPDIHASLLGFRVLAVPAAGQ